MDLRLLTGGVLAYGGAIVVEWLRMKVVYIPATVAVLPIFVLTGFGILVTIRGMMVKGEADSLRAGLLMVAGLILGVLGGLELFDAVIDHEHTVDVCGVSKVVLDPNAQWACPQVLASYLLQWPLAAGLLIPTVLFLVVPFFDVREQRSHLMRDTKPGGSTYHKNVASD